MYPLYNPFNPLFLYNFDRQSPNPLYLLAYYLCNKISALSYVLALSIGNTTNEATTPAHPPDIIFPPKYLYYSFLGS